MKGLGQKEMESGVIHEDRVADPLLPCKGDEGSKASSKPLETGQDAFQADHAISFAKPVNQVDPFGLQMGPAESPAFQIGYAGTEGADQRRSMLIS